MASWHTDHNDPWAEYNRQRTIDGRAAFEARADFAALVAEADRRGFRRPTLSEQCDPYSIEAHSWRGGTWVKKV